MILSQPGPQNRVPFTPPGGFYTPRLPRASFFSNLRPFAVLSPLVARGQWRPPMPGAMQPVPPRPPVEMPAPVMAPTGMKGFGTNFGRSVSPYSTMRTGLFPRISSSGDQIRRGIVDAPGLIKRATPGAFRAANVPGGMVGR